MEPVSSLNLTPQSVSLDQQPGITQELVRNAKSWAASQTSGTLVCISVRDQDAQVMRGHI